ncbi:hypothetical protein A0H81_04782 [Grifola frondosa]|uniref:Uncharacterized protein n=1 Tax=Grifola frondosa TaxID=5627 RepID=A0A1C7MEH1_GRIFR|nr:hypothetical protein A0H81_04782 [Grifola frondosa]
MTAPKGTAHYFAARDDVETAEIIVLSARLFKKTLLLICDIHRGHHTLSSSLCKIPPGSNSHALDEVSWTLSAGTPLFD